MSDPNENRPGYKPTKVGWIPEGWKVCTISDISRLPRSGYSAASEDRAARPGETGVLKLSCISGGTFQPCENKAVTDDAQAANLDTPVRQGSLIISRSNTEQLVGAVAYCSCDHTTLFLSDLMWQLSPRVGVTTDFRWFGHLLKSQQLRRHIIARANGTNAEVAHGPGEGEGK